MTTKTDRIYVRGLSSDTYTVEEYRRWLKSYPRVLKANAFPWEGGPIHWNRWLLTPENCPAQTVFLHLEELAPGGSSQKHGHQNEAMFYILEGKGYEIHDGKRYEWEAGDVVIVHNSCVHQHFNADADQPARALVIKAKPIFLFMNLVEQGLVEAAPKEGGKGYWPKD